MGVSNPYNCFDIKQRRRSDVFYFGENRCELVVRRPQKDSKQLVTSQRLLLGTVTPAPHHPRLVAHMSIPLTLTPINIGTKGPADIHTISPEEMKDIVTVTGLWLIVREGLGLGGVKSRKNEAPWRIGEATGLR